MIAITTTCLCLDINCIGIYDLAVYQKKLSLNLSLIFVFFDIFCIFIFYSTFGLHKIFGCLYSKLY